jgi:hypothetical protein
MKTDILKTLEYSKDIIISPDMDGFISAKLLEKYNDSRVVGTYDKNILCMAEGIDPKKTLFVDCDMNSSDFVSIGNHMRLLEDNMAQESFNPNTSFKISKYNEKFPFATCFLIAHAGELEIDQATKAKMIFADSTLKNMESYSPNMIEWSKRMPHSTVDYVIENSKEAKELEAQVRFDYIQQSFTSKRYGKTRYIETLNTALKSEGIKHLELTNGKKYLSDKVGLNTLMRYNKDIISYAEIFSGEYSVTYNEEISWT